MRVNDLIGNPRSVRISKVHRENKSAVTVVFQINKPYFEFAPGQFLMIWIPGVDEIPMSISWWDPPSVGITVLPIGEATKSLVSLHPNDWIGIRGPFGTSFTLESQRALVVGGGVGMAPLRPLIYSLRKRHAEITVLIAAKNRHELVFFDEFSQLSDNKLTVRVATEDGSIGFKGLATDATREILNSDEFDSLYTCGPELMMYNLLSLIEGYSMTFQASLERVMKCGCGVCGTCAIDPTGSLVCMDGPVYSGEYLSKISEFGKYHRNEMGVKEKF